jgi:hypothetical protein
MELDRSKYGYVYRIRNNVNGKTYIGQRKLSRDKTWTQYMGSGRMISHAIKKYGVENFSKEFICYASSKEELRILESDAILQEHLIGKAEYNIAGVDNALKVRISELEFTDDQLLSWYFDDELTYEEIAFKLNCSLTTVHRYMLKFRETDSRFDAIPKNGRQVVDPEHLAEISKRAHRKVVCEICTLEISFLNYERHFAACSQPDYVDGYRKHKCQYDGCETLIFKKNNHCSLHKVPLNGFQGIANPNSVKKGGLVASHNRWHVKRGIVKDGCELCSEIKLS